MGDNKFRLPAIQAKEQLRKHPDNGPVETF